MRHFSKGALEDPIQKDVEKKRRKTKEGKDLNISIKNKCKARYIIKAGASEILV